MQVQVSSCTAAIEPGGTSGLFKIYLIKITLAHIDKWYGVTFNKTTRSMLHRFIYKELKYMTSGFAGDGKKQYRFTFFKKGIMERSFSISIFYTPLVNQL